MINYPLEIVTSRPKSATEASRILRKVNAIENYVNSNCKVGENVFSYSLISSATGISEIDVTDILSELDGGHTGITIVKGN